MKDLLEPNSDRHLMQTESRPLRKTVNDLVFPSFPHGYTVGVITISGVELLS